MLTRRVMPCLLLRGKGLYKTVRFKSPQYVGDPINAVRIFNEKEVDELLVLDITATPTGRGPDFELIEDIASECFMPLCYGGGVTTIDQMKRLWRLGVEKISLNSAVFDNPTLVQESCSRFGSSSVVGAFDVKKNLFGRYEVWSHCGTRNTRIDPVRHAVRLVELGVGEILVNSIDRDGTMVGYDLDLLQRIASQVDVPVIACGGAGELRHLADALSSGQVSAVAAGSMFVFHGKHKAVLINYPTQNELIGISR